MNKCIEVGLQRCVLTVVTSGEESGVEESKDLTFYYT